MSITKERLYIRTLLYIGHVLMVQQNKVLELK